MTIKQIKSTIKFDGDMAESVGYYDWDVFGTDAEGNEARVKELLELPLIESVSLRTDNATWTYEIYEVEA